MPNLALIGQEGGYRTSSTIAHLVKFVVFAPHGPLYLPVTVKLSMVCTPLVHSFIPNLALIGPTDWVKVLRLIHDTRHISGTFFQPISCLNTEETKPNTTKARNTTTKWPPKCFFCFTWMLVYTHQGRGGGTLWKVLWPQALGTYFNARTRPILGTFRSCENFEIMSSHVISRIFVCVFYCNLLLYIMHPYKVTYT